MKRIAFTTILLGAAVASAQDPGGVMEKIQIHGVLSQGMMFSSANTTTKSSDGTLRWTEGAINFGTAISDQLHVGMQLRSHSVGVIGKQKVEIDWAFGDYKLNSYFGFRAGKVKTPAGLYNDMQDIDTLHSWALLPQSIYPADNRSFNLAHIGGVAYGGIGLKRGGSLSYQAYAGSRTLDPEGGFGLLLNQAPIYIAINDLSGPVYVVDLRWNTPFKGLRLGTTLAASHLTDGLSKIGSIPFPVDAKVKPRTTYMDLKRAS
jgi:hypothetical protein